MGFTGRLPLSREVPQFSVFTSRPCKPVREPATPFFTALFAAPPNRAAIRSSGPFEFCAATEDIARWRAACARELPSHGQLAAHFRFGGAG